ncbi:MAG TPA: MBL fold metallo-hydrolase, partial [Acidimicrobiales bacterium]|nr:MBL fold metallo-hydrolase [Acidimicrobiales bacterium]
MADLTVGEAQITGLVDGEFIAGPEYFGPAATFSGHEDLVAPDGKMHLPIGCFLIRKGRLAGRTVLVDAGLGEMSGDNFEGGALLKELSKAGSSTSSVDDIVISHLHIDHCGWLVDPDAQPIFENARIWIGAADWERFVEAGADVMLGSVREG